MVGPDLEATWAVRDAALGAARVAGVAHDPDRRSGSSAIGITPWNRAKGCTSRSVQSTFALLLVFVAAVVVLQVRNARPGGGSSQT